MSSCWTQGNPCGKQDNKASLEHFEDCSELNSVSTLSALPRMAYKCTTARPNIYNRQELLTLLSCSSQCQSITASQVSHLSHGGMPISWLCVVHRCTCRNKLDCCRYSVYKTDTQPVSIFKIGQNWTGEHSRQKCGSGSVSASSYLWASSLRPTHT